MFVGLRVLVGRGVLLGMVVGDGWGVSVGGWVCVASGVAVDSRRVSVGSDVSSGNSAVACAVGCSSAVRLLHPTITNSKSMSKNRTGLFIFVSHIEHDQESKPSSSRRLA